MTTSVKSQPDELVESPPHEVRSEPESRQPDPGRHRAEGAIRLALTSRAPRSIREHARRDLLRIATLIAADLLTTSLVWRMTAGPAPWVPLGHFAGAVLIALTVLRCYGAGDNRRDIGALLRAGGLGAALIMWPDFWTYPLGESFSRFLVLAFSLGVALVLERGVINALVRAIRDEDQQTLRAVVVGSSTQAARLIDHPAFGGGSHCQLVAFLDPSNHPDDIPAALAGLIRDRDIDAVILTGRLRNRVYSATLDVATASGCQVFSLPRVPPGSTLLPQISWRNGHPVVELTHPGLLGVKLVIKRAIDLVISATLLVLLSPLLAAIALAIRIKSPGPILFRQARIGQGGSRFTILKFRTMVPNAEQLKASLTDKSVYGDGRLFKVLEDPRVTPIGAFLRRTSLDELPQLWNVLRGDMSLVGPRPPLPSEVKLYEGHHYARFDVKPGITGPWQVSGRNSIRDFERVIRLETSYIRRWSIWLDLELLLRTVPAVFSRRGAH